MDISQRILSDLIVWMKYARFVPEFSRRETWEEIVTRNKEMHLRKFPDLSEEIEYAYKFVYDKKVLPSMRSMQFAGKPIEISPNRMYNCSYLPIDDWRAFSEIMFLLLGGTGVGYSVQSHHIAQLPEINKPRNDRSRRYLIGDSIEGWADAIKVLMKSYFFGGPSIRFDYSDIRAKGSRLITSGGKAPGPQPLKECIVKIEGILASKENGDQLSSLEVHDIVCHIADAVLAGGIRRAALISLFSATDEEMLSSKSGSWWELNPQRGRANNSVVLLRHRVDKETFDKIWDRIQLSGSGEPGFFFSNDKDWGTNPCGEIALRPFQFCNLTETNVSDLTDQEDLNARVRAAAFIGTLQAAYTDFHYLRPIWKRTTEKDALIGVSLTGIASTRVLDLNLQEASSIVQEENIRVSKILGIRPAARLTTVKPSGTASLVLGCSSGIHAWHNDYYLRRVRINKNESLYTYLAINHPELIEDEFFSPSTTAVITIPQRSPTDAILRTENPENLLERIKTIYSNWVKPGHRTGSNTHNVSSTVSIREDDWNYVREWMWENRNYYSGITVLPYDGGIYKQAPFEDCSEVDFAHLFLKLSEVNLEYVIENTDETNLSGELACAGGQCEIN